MKSQQQQKLELRERLHPVDLQRLLIENQGQLELLEKKTKQLLDLKREVGKISLSFPPPVLWDLFPKGGRIENFSTIDFQSKNL